MMKNYQKRYHPYEERFIRFSNFIEHYLTRILIVFLIILIIAQVALTYGNIRKWLVPLESIEGSIIWINTVL